MRVSRGLCLPIGACLGCMMFPSGPAPSAWAAPAPQAYIKASNTDVFDSFGRATAISGNTLVVGAPFEQSAATGVGGNQADNSLPASGAVYVFVRQGTNWVQQGYLKPSNTGQGDRFGWAVAVSGDLIVVGAPYEDSAATGVNGNGANDGLLESGAAYVFVRDGTQWTQQAYLKASNPGQNDLFGQSVAISGGTIVVGAEGAFTSVPESGAAYVFVQDSSEWSEQARLEASNAQFGHSFGCSVAISGDTVVVGAWNDPSNATGVNGNPYDISLQGAGAAFVFVRQGTQWTQQAYLKASNTGNLDGFGSAVGIAQDTIVVGAALEASAATGVNGNQADNSAGGAGAAYVFQRSGTMWGQQAYLKASNTGSLDRFGESVAVSGDSILVGASREDSNATAAGGSPSNNSAADAGAAYLFARHGTNWSQQAYLKPINTGSQDRFGCSVGLSGDTAVMGAFDEDGGAVGINGNALSNTGTNAGAAYVFTGLGVGPRIEVGADAGGPILRFRGAPDANYRVLRATNPSGPWGGTLVTLTAPASGWMEHQDTTAPPGPAFYRVVQP